MGGYVYLGYNDALSNDFSTCDLGTYSNECPETTTEPETTTVWETPGASGNGPGAFTHFETEVLPEGDYIVTLSVAISDPIVGNLNLHTSNRNTPTNTDYDCRPYLDSGNDEVCHISIESPTKIHMMVHNLVAPEFIGSPDVDPLSFHLMVESID